MASSSGFYAGSQLLIPLASMMKVSVDQVSATFKSWRVVLSCLRNCEILCANCDFLCNADQLHRLPDCMHRSRVPFPETLERIQRQRGNTLHNWSCAWRRLTVLLLWLSVGESVRSRWYLILVDALLPEPGAYASVGVRLRNGILVYLPHPSADLRLRRLHTRHNRVSTTSERISTSFKNRQAYRRIWRIFFTVSELEFWNRGVTGLWRIACFCHVYGIA